MKAKILTELPENLESVEAGTLYKLEGGYMYWCPGCGKRSFLNTENPSERPFWRQTGTEEQLTFSPSLHHAKQLGGCGWHGYLKRGIFSSTET